jgi:hypothetical protein
LRKKQGVLPEGAARFACNPDPPKSAKKETRRSLFCSLALPSTSRADLFANCALCREQFTVTIKTIFENSHIPLNKWLAAIYLMCSSKKGMSALHLQRALWGENPERKKPLGSYRTAWFLAHRIRWAMTQAPMPELLKGIIEAAETYIGPKEHGKRGMPGSECKKTPILALMERGGNVRSFR